MAINVKSFVLYSDQADTVAKLSNEQKGILFQSIFDWHNGIDSTINDPLVDLVFSMMVKTFERDAKKYANKCERLRANASKRKQMEPNATNCKQKKTIATKSKQIVGDSVSDSDSDSVSDSDSDSVSLKNERKKTTPLYPPAGEQIADLHPDAGKAVQEFYDFRKSIKSPMTDLAVKKLINKLAKLFENDFDMWQASVDQSILHNWTDVYEVKAQKKEEYVDPFAGAI